MHTLLPKASINHHQLSEYIMSTNRTEHVGLPSDQGEDGQVLRIKDIIRPFQTPVQGGSAILGFASDEGVRRNHGRTGASGAPAEIRSMLERLPVHGPTDLYDAGDITCLDGDLEGAQAALAERVAMLLGHNSRPVILGGGHEVAFGSFLGLAQHLAQQFASERILIINFDAHFDLRRAPHASSGTPFRQIAELCGAQGAEFRYLCFGISKLSNTTALFERARSLNVEYRLDEEMRVSAYNELRDTLRQRIAGVDRIYLSVDLDVLPAAVAPGVSAPAVRGISFEILEDLIVEILSSGKLALADVAELNPLFDQDGQTARLAARLAYRLAIG
jgi:formiminoglutamase